MPRNYVNSLFYSYSELNRGKQGWIRPWALTICMENSQIPGRFQMKWFIPVEIFQKKVIPVPFEVLPFSRSYQNEQNFLYHLFGLPVPGLTCSEKVKNLRVFCKWYNSIPFLFSVPKKIPVPFDRNFSPKFPYKWWALLVFIDTALPVNFSYKWSCPYAN